MKSVSQKEEKRLQQSIQDHEKELTRLKEEKERLERDLRKELKEEIEIRDA